jgi:putative SOS response-associated peptidase YedK
MCGRYTITVTMEELMTRFFIGDPSFDHYAPKFNAAPMQYIPAVIHDRMPVILSKEAEMQWLDRSNQDIPSLNIK